MMDCSTKLKHLPKAQNLNTHRWTPEEIWFKRKNRISSEIDDLNLPLRQVFMYKLEKSVMGTFLKELNTTGAQDNFVKENKLAILNWQLKRYNKHDLDIIENRNKIIQDYHQIITKAVTGASPIDLVWLAKHIESVCLNSGFIKIVDDTLRKFHYLQVLTLCGNFIKDISGSMLPRSLKFLELFDNMISNVSNLVQELPKGLLHLGLGRNRLTDDSALHLLSSNESTRGILSFDLCDNDICELETVLRSVKGMKSLKSIGVEGNPCWLIPHYKAALLKYITSLSYLDSTEILDTDKNESSEEYTNANIIFYCHRIVGLPEPPKDTKNAQTIHIEVNFPLLVPPQDYIDKQDQNEVDAHIEDNVETNETDDKKSRKKDKDRSSEAESDKKKKGNKKYYSAPDEYDPVFEQRNRWFKTVSMPWSKSIEFPPLDIAEPEHNLLLLRDCFRSLVPVRIIYKKVAPPGSKLKPKGKASKTKADKYTDVPEQLEDESGEAEIVLKRVTLASFYCELKAVNWSDTSLDFYWADHADIGNKAIMVNGSLKALDYSGLTENVIPTPAYPKTLTCQIGFGLNRN